MVPNVPREKRYPLTRGPKRPSEGKTLPTHVGSRTTFQGKLCLTRGLESSEGKTCLRRGPESSEGKTCLTCGPERSEGKTCLTRGPERSEGKTCLTRGPERSEGKTCLTWGSEQPFRCLEESANITLFPRL